MSCCSVFKRILPLPSDGWQELSGSFFCHTHGEEEVDHTHLSDHAKLVPKEGDCLISSSQLIIRGSALDSNRVVKSKVQIEVHVCIGAVAFASTTLLCTCRLYTEVQVSMLFTQPRAEGPRLCKSRRDRTEVYNGLVPWAMWP